MFCCFFYILSSEKSTSCEDTVCGGMGVAKGVSVCSCVFGLERDRELH